MFRPRKACLLLLMLLSIGMTPGVWAIGKVCVHSEPLASSSIGADLADAHHDHRDMAETESGIDGLGCGCGCSCVAASCVGTATGMAVTFVVDGAFTGRSFMATRPALAGTRTSHDFELIRPPSFS